MPGGMPKPNEVERRHVLVGGPGSTNLGGKQVHQDAPYRLDALEPRESARAKARGSLQKKRSLF